METVVVNICLPPGVHKTSGEASSSKHDVDYESAFNHSDDCDECKWEKYEELSQ